MGKIRTKAPNVAYVGVLLFRDTPQMHTWIGDLVLIDLEAEDCDCDEDSLNGIVVIREANGL